METVRSVDSVVAGKGDVMDEYEQGPTQNRGPQHQLSREEIKRWSRDAFKSQYGTCVLIAVIVAAINVITDPSMWEWISPSISTGFSSNAFELLLGLFVMSVLSVGEAGTFLKVYCKEQIQVSDLFSGFSNYVRNLAGMLWMYLFTALWSCLLIIPGIVKAIAYSFTPYLLKEYPDIAATDAIKISMRMTYGHKDEIFFMYLSFIGWWLLSIPTLGLLGILYVYPYYEVSVAGLYEKYKDIALADGIVDQSELVLG